MAGLGANTFLLVLASFACAQSFLVSRENGGPLYRCMLACGPGTSLAPNACVCIRNGDPLKDTTSLTTKHDTSDLDLKETLTCRPQRCPMTFVPCSVYHKDKQGCLTCRCKCTPLLMQCPTDCRYGTEYAKDVNGCKVCQCAPRPKGEDVEPVLRCPGLCRMYCPFGNAVDRNGCPICRCNPQPVL